MKDADTLSRFLFEHAGIRGNLIHLDASWRAVLDAHTYPAAVQEPLGQALAAVSLLAATIKFEGSLILQVQSAGPIRTLVAQATNARTLRGLARWQGEVPEQGSLDERFGEGRLVLTVQRQNADPYQGVVPLEGADLADAIEAYFKESEQLKTRLWLTANGEHAAGLLLQKMPNEDAEDEDWERVEMLADTLTTGELRDLPTQELLYRLFNEETVKLFEPEPMSFRCGCSRSRIEDTVKMLSEAEVDSILAEQGAIEVTCEFCNREYRFDSVDTRQLFASPTRHEPPQTRQ
ncbi:Hsp33 family molecular chaperone HslO [Thiorhodococcus mannitoliphagus]|uniref:33 kDa chaperonin n=1 Tax=Thiorhodococcus mannitoliphagus TaxID=329406 RepID=A0A6P1DZS5_9GAMM|nr:Hsp33 family molecular chaperone HslO [Thiorhodococcus mannitoliphagus]NEX22531.1 Hsp33 family molecular chaperone HslO [Thiorhodococcus mannitoliphagus]